MMLVIMEFTHFEKYLFSNQGLQTSSCNSKMSKFLRFLLLLLLFIGSSHILVCC